MVGYSSPAATGSQLRKKLADEIAKLRQDIENADIAGAREVQAGLSEIFRDQTETAQNRLRAGELLAKIHGLLSERVQMSLDRKSVKEALDSTLDALSEAAQRKRLVEPRTAKALPALDSSAASSDKGYSVSSQKGFDNPDSQSPKRST